MVLDKELEIADAAELNTGGAGTYRILTGIDLGDDAEARNALGDSGLYLVIEVDTTVESGGAGTYEFVLVSDAQAAVATDGTATTHFTTGPIPVAALVAGYRVCAVPLPFGATYERYLGVLQVTAVAAATAGKVNVFVTTHPGRFVALPNAVNA